MSERFICGDCQTAFVIENKKRGSALIEAILWATLFILGPIYGMWRSGRPKKKCDYCGSNFILPDTPENREFLKPTSKK
ncbi:MAG: hypothetical protein EBS06_03025 [Proteobacteria bacterium]|nr:hypothetical protein [Pseudomonadota bacterium]